MIKKHDFYIQVDDDPYLMLDILYPDIKEIRNRENWKYQGMFSIRQQKGNEIIILYQEIWGF